MARSHSSTYRNALAAARVRPSRCSPVQSSFGEMMESYFGKDWRDGRHQVTNGLCPGALAAHPSQSRFALGPTSWGSAE